jgi:hypothetical protein
VSYYWIVDPVGRTVEAGRLVGAAYVPAGSVTNEAAVLPPFTGLQIEPATVWS